MVMAPVWLTLLLDLKVMVLPTALAAMAPVCVTPPPSWLVLLPVTVIAVPPGNKVIAPTLTA